MTTAFFSHDDCKKHNMGPEHPESPERLSSILAYLADTNLQQELDWVRPEEITRDQLLTVHPESYLHQLDLMQPTRGASTVHSSPDTSLATLRFCSTCKLSSTRLSPRVWACTSENTPDSSSTVINRVASGSSPSGSQLSSRRPSR